VHAAMANANLIIIMITNLKTYVDSQLEKRSDDDDDDDDIVDN
jgi:hypothetical protein